MKALLPTETNTNASPIVEDKSSISELFTVGFMKALLSTETSALSLSSTTNVIQKQNISGFLLMLPIDNTITYNANTTKIDLLIEKINKIISLPQTTPPPLTVEDSNLDKQLSAAIASGLSQTPTPTPTPTSAQALAPAPAPVPVPVTTSAPTPTLTPTPTKGKNQRVPNPLLNNVSIVVDALVKLLEGASTS